MCLLFPVLDNHAWVLLTPIEWKGEVVKVKDWSRVNLNCIEEIKLSCSESTDPTINKKLGHSLAYSSDWEVDYQDKIMETNQIHLQQIVRNWKAIHKTDKALQHNCTQTIYIQDKLAPVAEQVTAAANITVSVHQEMALLTVLSFRPSFTDNCTATDDIKVELLSEEVTADKTCPKQQTYVRRWIGIDTFGNISAPYEQIVVAEDEDCQQESWVNH